jgi:DNA-binding MarR family transcriptional regulator
MPKKHILEGDLSRIQLPDVLSFLSMIRGTGKLVLVHERMERSIYWKDGEIVFASSNSPEHSLGMFLLRNGKITQQQYDESKRRVTAATRHGKLLVQMGAISPKDLWWGVKNQALEIIYSLFSWKEGSFVFGDTADELVNERIVLSIHTSTVIMEGIRRLDESAVIREKITSLDMVFMKVQGAVPDFGSLDMSEHEVALYKTLDGKRSIRALIGGSEMTEFEVTRILFQLLSARLIEVVADTRSFRPVFLDVEDSPELLKVISTYNDMFGRLYAALLNAVGEEPARDIVTTAMQNAESDELWSGVFFDQYGRFDENMLIANISELPFERRKAVLDEGLNTLLSVQLFEVSQHLDSAGKVDVFRFISDQKAGLDSILT